jgi:hypothetical protein
MNEQAVDEPAVENRGYTNNISRERSKIQKAL